MLFPYTYIPHQMEKMQSFVNFIFYQVWCRAPKTGPYSLSLFDANPSLKEVMESFAYDHRKEGDLFSSRIQSIYEDFAKLTRADIAQLKRWYQSNNDIECACNNVAGSQIVRYADVEAKHPKLGGLLKAFFANLYSSDLLSLKALQEKIGKIDDHYHCFMDGQSVKEKCPFCGIADMLSIYHSKREAYDHYLPKGIYPFNSINFRNLVPACHHCNSSYKTSQNPAYTPKDPAGTIHRRKVFYPYANPGPKIEVTIDLSKPDVDHLAPDDIQLTFGPPAFSEEIETWKDVYGIEERYKAKCCSGDAKDWLEQIRIFRDAYDIDPTTSLNTLQHQTEKSPFANCNFLKKSFLEGCQRRGLLD